MNFMPFGKATDVDILDFEEKMNLKLPEDYKKFLRSYNGGLFRSAMIWVPYLDAFIPPDSLLGFNYPDDYRGNDLLKQQHEMRHEIFASEVFIGRDAGNNFFFLNCSPEFAGVYYYDRLIFFRKSRRRKTIYLIAYTFDDFLRRIESNTTRTVIDGYSQYQPPVHWKTPLQWPDPLPKMTPKRWPPRKPALWNPGEEPTFDPNEIPAVLLAEPPNFGKQR